MRTLIVDDSEIDRLNLRTLLEDHAGIQLAGEARTLDEAVMMIDTLKPDLVFLDIHLGKEIGFNALGRIQHRPQVIITTAHPHYALRGFEVDAVDYLLKPLMEEPLARALGRLADFTGGRASGTCRLLPEDVQIFKRGDGFDVVPVSEILTVVGERIYTRIIARNPAGYLHNRRLREWKDLLPEEVFKSLDRSTIVNVRELRGIKDMGSEGHKLSFRESNSTVLIGSTAMKALREILG